MLKIKHGNLIEDWMESSRNTVDDYIISQSKVKQSQINQEICVNENWIRDPPNTLFFALSRLNYDVGRQCLVKDLSEFRFEKLIHVDRMLEANQGRIIGVYAKAKKYQEELKSITKLLESEEETKVKENLEQTANHLRLQIKLSKDQNQIFTT